MTAQQNANPGEPNPEELARRFEEKKRLLESAGIKSEAKEIFRAAFKEEMEKKNPPPLAASAPRPAAPPPSVAPADAADEVSALVSLALAEGVWTAVKKAEAETPYLIDALHDELADHYYDRLIALGHLKPE